MAAQDSYESLSSCEMQAPRLRIGSPDSVSQPILSIIRNGRQNLEEKAILAKDDDPRSGITFDSCLWFVFEPDS